MRSIFTSVLVSILARTVFAGVYGTDLNKSILGKRAACAKQPAGVSGYRYSPDNAVTFKSNPAFAHAANVAVVPAGYSVVYQDSPASSNGAGKSLGLKLLSTYNVAKCASLCSTTKGCQAFEIFFERSYTRLPGPTCKNPPSRTLIKCAMWSRYITKSQATNSGSTKASFHIVRAGANAYISNSLLSPTGYNNRLSLGSAAIVSAYDSEGADTYIGSKTFKTGAFNFQRCADYCSSTSQSALVGAAANGSIPRTCQYFNTYIAYVNNLKTVTGQVCALYSETWPAKAATNKGSKKGKDKYLIASSYAFSNATNPGSANKLLAIQQAVGLINGTTRLEQYCTTLLEISISGNTRREVNRPFVSKFLNWSPVVEKRSSNSAPSQLKRFPSSILSSACSIAQPTPSKSTGSSSTSSSSITSTTTSSSITSTTTSSSSTSTTTSSSITSVTSSSSIESTTTITTSLIVTSTTIVITSTQSSSSHTSAGSNATDFTCVNSPSPLAGQGPCNCMYNQTCGANIMSTVSPIFNATVANVNICRLACDTSAACVAYRFQFSDMSCQGWNESGTFTLAEGGSGFAYGLASSCSTDSPPVGCT